MGVTALSSSESKYFKRFGLQPPTDKGVPGLSLNADTTETPHEVQCNSCVFYPIKGSSTHRLHLYCLHHRPNQRKKGVVLRV